MALTSDASRGWTYWPGGDQPHGIQAVITLRADIWVGTVYGVYRVNPRTGAYTPYPEVGPIELLLPIEHGQVWAAGAHGVFFFDGQTWQSIFAANGIVMLGIDVHGDLWLLDEADRQPPTISHFSGHIPPDNYAWSYREETAWPGQNVFDCATWAAIVLPRYTYRTSEECQALQTARSITTPPHYILPVAAVIERGGSVWWANGSTLQHRRPKDQVDRKLPTARLTNTTIQQALPATQVNAITLDPDRGVWLGTDRGLLYADGVTIRSVSLGQEQSTLRARPRNIAVDTLGRVWVVTAQGIQMLPAHSLTWQDVTDVDLGPSLNQWPLGTIAAAREGDIWATHGQDLWRFGGPATTLLLNAPLPEPGCRLIHLAVDPDGNVWSPLSDCTAHEIVFRPETGEWQLDPPNTYVPQWSTWQSDYLPDVGTIRDETPGPDGRVWIVGDRGIAVYAPQGGQP